MTFINKKGVAVVAGGIDQFGRWLEDIWLFDFIRINWTRVNTSPSIPESVGYLLFYIVFWQATVLVQSAHVYTFTMEMLIKSGRRHSGCWRHKAMAIRRKRQYFLQNCPLSRASCQIKNCSQYPGYDLITFLSTLLFNTAQYCLVNHIQTGDVASMIKGISFFMS